MPMWDDTGNLGGQGIQLEKQAQAQFGATVADFHNQSSSLTSSVYNGRDTSSNTTQVDNSQSVSSNVWQSPRYADDLIAVAPKHRFLFKVHFYFNAPYVGDRDQSIFTFLVKNIQKPKVSYEYQAVNMYNFRTQILINIKHDPLTIDFHDDIGNYVHEFFNAYRKAYSPISRTRTPATSAQFETTGMDFAFPDASSVSGGNYSASSGQLLNGTKNVLNYIEIEQYFGHGTRKNIFKFLNPRIENFDFDEATHEGQELHSLKVSFNYDSLVIDTESVSGTAKGSFGKYEIMGETPLKQFGTQPMSTFQKAAPGSLAAAAANNFSSISTVSTFPTQTNMVVQRALSLPQGQQSSFIQGVLPGSLGSVGNAQQGQLQNLLNNKIGGVVNTNLGSNLAGNNVVLAGLINPSVSFARNQASKTLYGATSNITNQSQSGVKSVTRSSLSTSNNGNAIITGTNINDAPVVDDSNFDPSDIA